MSKDAHSSWWDFSVDKGARSQLETATTNAYSPKNAHSGSGEKPVTYHRYLELDKLLEAQNPLSNIPDERVFIITHQLFEITFKQILFDILVISTTLNDLLLEKQEADFHTLATKELDSADDDFWGPALFSARRVIYTCQTLLPTIMLLLSGAEATGGELFSNQEFKNFRESLIPSSGFQTAQLRLIQKAFGKSNLLKLMVFPGSNYSKGYEDREDTSLVAITDKVILQEGAAITSPENTHPHAKIMHFDDLLHQVLTRLAAQRGNEEDDTRMPLLKTESVEKASNSIAKILKIQHPELKGEHVDASVSRFEENFLLIREDENARRREYQGSIAGADYLRESQSRTYLKTILDAIVSADDSLHKNAPDSFLRKHYDIAKYHTDHLELKGTGGGGIAYLSFSINILLPLFPALVGYRLGGRPGKPD